MKAAYLGPAGTYSQEAAFKAFGQDHEPVLCSSLAEVVSRVARSEVDGAVLPIENSTNGAVDLAVDAILNCHNRSNVNIIGDVHVLVKHQLYTLASSLNTIRTVYSHPQVWGQAQGWLESNLPNAKRLDCSSTAEAVRLALASDESIAALGGPLTSDRQPFVANCADDATNTTRFLILRPGTPDDASSTSTTRKWANVVGKSSDLFTGSNNSVLGFVASVPDPAPWKYSYLVEFEGPLPENWTLLGSETARGRL